jgi:HEAT repeat protein
MWFSQAYPPGTDVRIQALARLIPTDAEKVIPMLRYIAFHEEAGPAKGAIFVLASSRVPEAQNCVVDVAKTGPEPVRVAAVRELGRFGGSNISRDLLDVYSTANWPVKQQVVLSLGERADTTALLRIVQSESDDRLLEMAIVTLGKAGGSAQLRVLLPKTTRGRMAQIRGLFTARDEEGLIRIAQQEKDTFLRNEALNRLRLLDTPKAKAYLESIK